MDKEISFYGHIYSEGCPGCNRQEPQGPALKIIFETNHFRVHQDYVLPIPGMMVIESKRHIAKLSELTQEESEDFMNVWRTIDNAIKSLDDVDNVFHALEDRSSHFHFWLMPIYPWMKEAASDKLRNIQNIFDYVKTEMITPEWIEKTEKATEKIFLSLSK